MLATHNGALDAVEPDDLSDHDGRRDSIQSEDDKCVEPSLPEQVADCNSG